jgi:phosphoglycolate phosphatase-like HAD superfamily hydrolase
MADDVTSGNLNAVLSADAYLFDIDGTLLNTRDLVHWNALHTAMLEAYGVDTTIEGIQYHGKTDLGILRAATERMGVSASHFEQNLTVALEVVCREVRLNSANIDAVVCRSICDVLQYLDASGKLLGVASGNLAAVGWMKLAACALSDFFSFGSFNDHCEKRCDIFQNAVDEARARLGKQAVVCFVGDTPADIAAARQVGARIVAVATGTFSCDELRAHEPDICADCCGNVFIPSMVNFA